MSSYGTFDQGGNVVEFTETYATSQERIARGGSWISPSSMLKAVNGYLNKPSDKFAYFGFRVAGVQVPEPSTLALLGMAGIGLMAYGWRRRKAHRIVVCLIALLVSTAGMAWAVTIETVPIGNAGNTGEQSRLYASDHNYYGGVAYDFQIGKFELTNPQYCEFLNAKAKSDPYGLFNNNGSFLPTCGITRSGSAPNYSYAVKSGYETMPATIISWYDALRYANWMTNGQGDGDTESGSYKITGGSVDFGLVVAPTAAERAAWAAGGKRYWLLPTENEWYKAAYHKNDGVTNHYWRYATGTDADPYSDNPASLNFPANSANYAKDDGLANGFNDGFAATGSTVYDQFTINYLTNVGAYSQSPSPYGTYDQNGNVAEWNETKNGSPIISGGSWDNTIGILASSARGTATGEGDLTGFRLVCIGVPEPATLALLGMGSIGLIAYGWRRKAHRIVVCFIALLVSTAGMAWADTFGTGANQFTLDFVPISGATNPTSGRGIVNHDYCMGTYAISNDQWNKFTASLGVPVTGSPSSAYDASFYDWGTGTTDVPANEISWYEAAQFVNWLNTNTGHQATYKFTGTPGTNDYTFTTWSAAEADQGTNLYRHKDAYYFLPTENEWVKAAYWNGTSLQQYATKPGDTLFQGDGTNGGWNYHITLNATNPSGPWAVTNGSQELNGTYNMMGNVQQWMESPYSDATYGASSSRGLRGGMFFYDAYTLASSTRTIGNPTMEGNGTGFRVVSVPEPSTLALLLFATLGGLLWWRRKR